MRVLHYHRHGGNLDSINAVLGFAILLPKCFRVSSVAALDAMGCDIYEEFGELKGRKLMDCLYLTVNWLRESISGFVSQNDQMIRKKVRIYESI